MDARTYEIESQLESYHWWFVTRRDMFTRYIQKLNLKQNASILDVGTSSGTNLRMLKAMGFTHFKGIDISPLAAQIAKDKGLGKVDIGNICKLPYPKSHFDLILATDIIEHVDDDLLALQELQRVLKSNGTILLTVPAFPSLWGLQDIVSHHKRRYRKAQLIAKFKAANLHPRTLYHFNYLLFIPIWLMRQIIKIGQPNNLKSENEINAPWINAILKRIFKLDTWSAPLLRPPFGVSIFTLLSKEPEK
ncbi:MAG: class I SAM-dependent methyltransferase [Pseudomonadota bacterium]